MKPSERYTLIRLLGAGGMGEVYLAEDGLLKRTVAIKKVKPSTLGDLNLPDRIGRECILHAKVGSHPNIVSLYDRIDIDDEIMLVMEYVPGKPLRNLMEARLDGLSLREAVQITIQTLSAMEAVHALDIIHRDIKPENIMVIVKDDGEMQAKLLDFGIARGGGQLSITSTAAGSPGTPKYMAPEQIDPEAFGRVSPATDVYAIGIMLYELITGQTPFLGNFHEILAGHLHRSLPEPKTRDGRAVPKELTAIVHKATARMQPDRYASAREFGEALRRFGAKLSVPLSVTEAPTAAAPTGNETVISEIPVGAWGSAATSARGGAPTPPPGTAPYPTNPTPPVISNPTPVLNPTGPMGGIQPASVKGSGTKILLIGGIIAIFLFGFLITVAVLAFSMLSGKGKTSTVAGTSTGTEIAQVQPTPVPATPAPTPEPLAASPAPTNAPPTASVAAPTATAEPARPTASPAPSTAPATATAAPSPSAVATADSNMINEIVRLKKLQVNIERLYKEKSFDITKSSSYLKGKKLLSQAEDKARSGAIDDAKKLLTEAAELLQAAEKDAKSTAW
jgi:serine/threonine protein kinase